MVVWLQYRNHKVDGPGSDKLLQKPEAEGQTETEIHPLPQQGLPPKRILANGTVIT